MAKTSYFPRFQSAPLIMCGVDSTMNAPLPTTGIAAQLAALFPSARVINNCVNGLTLAAAVAAFSTTNGAQINFAYERNVALFVGGANDITQGAGADDVLDSIDAFWNLNIAAGAIPIVCTIIADGAMSGPQDSIRQDVVAGIRSIYPASRIADWAANTHFDTQAKTSNTTYYYDTIHPTVLGGGILAGIAQTPITSILA